jgi:hypothetical protein
MMTLRKSRDDSGLEIGGGDEPAELLVFDLA